MTDKAAHRLLIITVLITGLVLTVLSITIQNEYIAWVAGASTSGGVLGLWR